MLPLRVRPPLVLVAYTLPLVTGRHPAWPCRGNRVLWPWPSREQRTHEGVNLGPHVSSVSHPKGQGGKAGIEQRSGAPLGL